jgi:hypothetical protein
MEKLRAGRLFILLSGSFEGRGLVYRFMQDKLGSNAGAC